MATPDVVKINVSGGGGADGADNVIVVDTDDDGTEVPIFPADLAGEPLLLAHKGMLLQVFEGVLVRAFKAAWLEVLVTGTVAYSTLVHS